MAYMDPLKGLSPRPTLANLGRTDQGVDFAGTGPVYAMGSGTILSTTNAGWPGGGFIVIKLDNPIAGYNAYYTAEDITPHVSVGQHVKAGQQIGTAFAGTTGLELGWAQTGSGLGASYASAHGGYTEGEVTAAGKSFRSVLTSLMSGKQPAGGSTSSTGSTSSSGSGGTGTSATGSGDQLTADTSPSQGAAAGTGCLISCVAWPVLIPLALWRRRGRR